MQCKTKAVVVEDQSGVRVELPRHLLNKEWLYERLGKILQFLVSPEIPFQREAVVSKVSESFILII